MAREQLLVPLLLLALQLGMHGAYAARNPHADEDMVPGERDESDIQPTNGLVQHSTGAVKLSTAEQMTRQH